MAEQLIAHTRLWETENGRLVEEGDPAATFLVAGEGAVIAAAVAERLGLEAKGGKVVQAKAKAEEAAVPSTAEPEPQSEEGERSEEGEEKASGASVTIKRR